MTTDGEDQSAATTISRCAAPRSPPYHHLPLCRASFLSGHEVVRGLRGDSPNSARKARSYPTNAQVSAQTVSRISWWQYAQL